MLKEFQTFIMRGNVLDLAVGIIIGAAFTGIVNSLVNDIIMPPIGFALGGVDFSNLFYSLNGTAYESLAAAKEAGAPTINYGVFINALIQFLIVAVVVFLLIRAVNRMMTRFEKKKDDVVVVEVEPTTDEKLLKAIEDLTAAIKTEK
jgi:large conductance mechanosensitive channel